MPSIIDRQDISLKVRYSADTTNSCFHLASLWLYHAVPTIALMTRRRIILIGFGMSVWVTLVVHLSVRCLVMNDNVWFQLRGERRVAGIGCGSWNGRFVNGYLRIFIRIFGIGSTISIITVGRRGRRPGQSRVIRVPKAVVLFVVMFPICCQCSSTCGRLKLCIAICLLLTFPKRRILLSARCIAICRARTKSFLLLVASIQEDLQKQRHKKEKPEWWISPTPIEFIRGLDHLRSYDGDNKYCLLKLASFLVSDSEDRVRRALTAANSSPSENSDSDKTTQKKNIKEYAQGAEESDPSQEASEDDGKGSVDDSGPRYPFHSLFPFRNTLMISVEIWAWISLKAILFQLENLRARK